MGRAEEVPAGPHLLVRAERQRLLVDLQRRELVPELAQDLDVDDELLVAGHEPGLEPAGRVQHEVGARQEGGQHRHQRLVGRLGVHGLAGVEPASASPWQPERAGDLPGAQQPHRGLRCPERGRARLHVRVREE